MAIYKNNQEVKDIYMVGHGLPDPNAVGLQEDVDYVRYEWLVGDGAAYIDTLVSDLTNVDVVICYFSAKGVLVDNRIFGREMSGSWLTVGVDMNNNSRLSVWIGNSLQYPSIATNEDFIEIDLINNIARTSLQSYNFNAPASISRTFYLFGNNGYNIPFVGKIKQFNIGNILHFVPCRLLRPIPAALDANNKARQEGEYGMIDLVSKKFYGNVNNSGSFTGEGLIQKKVTFAFFNGKHVYGEMQEGVHIRRYGWLKGDIPFNVSLQHLPINSTNFEFKRNWIQIMNSGYFNTSNSNNAYAYYIANTGGINDLKPRIWDGNNKVNAYVSSSRVGLGIHTIVANDGGVTINSATNTVTLPWYGNPNNISFNNANNQNKKTIHLTSSILVDNSIRYTPCKLLRPIPPELDANGIARAAGTCGMYDEVNHKIYGNVASSGSFTVEGMAEGYDYEVYTYLKGTGGCYIDTLINPAWNDQLSATTEVSGQPTVQNPTILRAYGTNIVVALVLNTFWYLDNTPRVSAVHREIADNVSLIYYDGFSASAEIYVSLKVTNNAAPTTSCKINGATWTSGSTSGTNIITALPDTTYKIGRDTANGLDVLKLKNVKINSHNFMPCKLLRAIPAELDANGIARNAEECGMVDTYTGLFYGNVNSDGTFTVEGGLVEGYHYEKYDWIERKSRNTGNMFSLTLSNTADTIVRIWNYKTQGTNGRDMIYLNNTDKSKYFIYPDLNAEGKTLMRHSDSSSPTVIATEQDVELTLRSGKVNGITTRAYNSISICPSTVSGNLTKVGRIYSDSYDYVPCKLLRNIPANRTVDGNSYPAGTAGMVEKFSGKFQPIASALSLTLSNDE